MKEDKNNKSHGSNNKNSNDKGNRNRNGKNIKVGNGFFYEKDHVFQKISLNEISSLSLNRHAIEILVFIISNHPNNLLMKDIANGLHLNKNHLSKISFDLLAKGLISKMQNVTDVRSNYIGISEKGIDVLYSLWMELDNYFSAKLPEIKRTI